VRPGRAIVRFRIRRQARISQRDHPDEEDTIKLTRIVSDPELLDDSVELVLDSFDDELEIVQPVHEVITGPFIDALVAWLQENWMTILKMLLMLLILDEPE